MFVIRNKKTGEYWSNDWGWGSSDGCDIFDDKKHFQMPIDGEWVSVEAAQWDELTNNN